MSWLERPKERVFGAMSCHSASTSCLGAPTTCYVGVKNCLFARSSRLMPTTALFPNRPARPLVVKAQAALGMTHRKFGEALGASERTSLRWTSGASTVSVAQLSALAKLVYPRDAALAKALAEASSETLESLGIVAPRPPAPTLPAPTAPSIARLAPHLVADLVVCAAANAIGASPATARAALVAAFARVRELGLGVAEVEGALGASPPVDAPPPWPTVT